MTWGFMSSRSSFMSGLSRFCRRARSLLARRSDVGGRVACQKRVDWSRPATGIPSDAITQRDNRRNGPRRRAVARYWLSLSRDSRLPSGLNPHLGLATAPGCARPPWAGHGSRTVPSKIVKIMALEAVSTGQRPARGCGISTDSARAVGGWRRFGRGPRRHRWPTPPRSMQGTSVR